MNTFEDPDMWTYIVEPLGRRYLIYLCPSDGMSALRYGPYGYGWVRRSLPRAFAKGERELKRYRKRLHQRAERSGLIAKFRAGAK